MPLAHGARSLTQIIVGTRMRSISTTVNTASSNEITMACIQRLIGHQVLPRLQCAATRDQVSGGEVGHRVQREQEEQPERDEQRCAKSLPAQRGLSHCSHLAVRRTRRLYATITMATMTIISSASAYAKPDWPSTTSLVSAARISSGTIGLP